MDTTKRPSKATAAIAYENGTNGGRGKEVGLGKAGNGHHASCMNGGYAESSGGKGGSKKVHFEVIDAPET